MHWNLHFPFLLLWLQETHSSNLLCFTAPDNFNLFMSACWCVGNKKKIQNSTKKQHGSGFSSIFECWTKHAWYTSTGYVASCQLRLKVFVFTLYLLIYTFLSLNGIMGLLDYSPTHIDFTPHVMLAQVVQIWTDGPTERPLLGHQGLALSFQPPSLYSDYPCLIP